MATDVEKLVVQMSADFKAFQNELARVSGITREELRRIRESAANAGAAAEGGFDGAARGVTKFGASARGAQAGVKALQAQTGNLAAQFQDIGVQLAGGQSPLLIALQQGTQISSVLGGAGAGGAVKALAGAFASLVSPVSLVTIGLIAAGGAAIQYFSGLLDNGEKSAEELKKQADLIQQVAKEWGNAIPFIQRYAEAAQQASRAADLREAGAAVIADIWAPVKERVAEARIEIEELIAKLTTLGADTSSIANLQDAFAILEGKVKDQTATAQDAEDVAATLNATMSGGIPLAGGLADAMSGLAGALASVSAQAAAAQSNINAALNAQRTFREADAASMRALESAEAAGDRVIAQQERRNSLTAEQIALEDEVARVKRDVADAGGIVDDGTAQKLAQQTLAAEKARAEAARAASAAAKSSGGGGGRSAAISDVQREREAVTKLIEQLQFEQSIVGLSDVEKEKANALRRAGAAATEEQRAQIAALVEQTYAETEALKQNQEQLDAVRQLSSDVLGGIFEDLRDGASAADVLSNALNRVAESFVKAGIDQLINGAFPTGGGGGLFGGGGGLFGGRIIPGILHGGGVAGVDGYAHGRSVSPSVFLGARRYHTGGVAGLMPGEVPAILQKGETVLPRGASSGAVDVRVYMDRDGNWQAEVERISGGVTARGMAVVRKDVPKIMSETQRRVGR